MSEIVTEFLYLDPLEMHLVGKGANGFAPLLAKAAEEVDAVLGEADLRAILAESGASKTLCDDITCEYCTGVLEKAKLKAKQRNALPDSDFALPGRRYPIHDESHARNALSRVAQNGTPEEKTKVRAAVHRRYPNIGQEDAEKAMISQQAGEHQAGSGSPEASLGQTRENDVTPNGNRGPVSLDNGQDGGAPPSKPEPRPADHQGGGDTAPDKNIPQGEALSQTNEVTRKEEAEKAAPGSPEWEAKDIELANQAVKALSEALDIVKQFASREKAEAKKGEINDAISRANQILSGLVDGTNNNQVATKEIDDMTTDELMKLLDERDAKKEAERKTAEETAAKEAAEKKPDPDAGAQTTVEKDAPAPESTGTPDTSLTKSILEGVQGLLEPLEKRIANVENQPARPRPAVNDAGVRAGVAAPDTRGQDQTAGSTDVLKALEDKVTNARTPQELARARNTLLMAKMIQAENVREAQGPSRGPVPLLATAAPTKEAAAAMAQDFRG